MFSTTAVRLPARLLVSATLILVSGVCTFAAERGIYPLQHQPGPTGDPGQDPITFPKSKAAPQNGVKKVMPLLPSLVDAGHGDFRLVGGWKLESFTQVAHTILELSTPGYDATKWMDATVPGTVLTTMVDQGIYPEPSYGLNNLAIPESLARQDYWYRNEFTVPADYANKTLTLQLKGVNYAADIWLNGQRLGEIRGAFMRGTFDVSKLIRPGQPNALAIRISPTPHPGIPHEESIVAGAGAPNGGSMTFDGPTFFCSEGWDWIPGIRDREAGLWQDVVLHVSQAVTVGDLHVMTTLPQSNKADVFISVPVENHTDSQQKVRVKGEFEGGSFEQEVLLAPRNQGYAKVNVAVENPRLWWPNGYGKPELYHMKLAVLDSTGKTLETKVQRFGIRQVTYELAALDSKGEVKRYEFDPSKVWSTEIINKRHGALREDKGIYVPTLVPAQENSPALKSAPDEAMGNQLVIKVNGVRIACRGGNWGLDEMLKRVSREKLEPYFRMERDLGLTIIRNWCGQNTEESFFELADEYGLMVWNDFWMSTQDWNMQPGDPALFLANAEDTIKRFRNHPSIVMWCGRNEGVPPPVLNEGLDRLVREHDSSRYFQPSSVAINQLWSGPWVHSDPKNFFDKHGIGFTTELGLPCAPTADAIRAMMPESEQWPISDSWAYHDWHQAHHGEVQPFMESMAKSFGAGKDLDDFCRKAQMLNYVGHRALFEGMNAHLWKPASGRFIWMSHPTWPSMEWELYTMDGDTNGATFGARKAMEPIHVQFNLHDRKVIITNTTREALEGVTVEATLLDLAGRCVNSQKKILDVIANASTDVFLLDEQPVANVKVPLLKLTLKGKNGLLLSDNFYWLPRKEEDLQVFNSLEKTQLSGSAKAIQVGGETVVEVRVKNTSRVPSLLLKPTLRNAKGERVLPVFPSDGCFSLLPGESRSFTFGVPKAQADMKVTFEGWNNAPVALVVTGK